MTITVTGTISRSKEMTDTCPGCGADKHKHYHACPEPKSWNAYLQHLRKYYGGLSINGLNAMETHLLNCVQTEDVKLCLQAVQSLIKER